MPRSDISGLESMSMFSLHMDNFLACFATYYKLITSKLSHSFYTLRILFCCTELCVNNNKTYKTKLWEGPINSTSIQAVLLFLFLFRSYQS